MRELFIMLSLIMLTASCSVSKIANHEVSPAEIKEISWFEPVSFIALIEKGNQQTVNDSLSSICTALLDSIMNDHKVRRNMRKIEVEDPMIKSRLQNEVTFLIQTAAQSRKLNGIKLTPTIDSLLKANNQRFAIATVASGFGRKAGNYGNQLAKGIGVGILSLGMVVPVPNKSNLSLFAIIMDAERNEVIYYCRTLPVEKSPTDKKVIYERYANLFNGYLYDK